MRAIRKTVKIPEDREIRVKLPPEVNVNDHVEVIILIKKTSTTHQKKIDLIKEAVTDKLFLEDLRYIAEDFQIIDSEHW